MPQMTARALKVGWADQSVKRFGKKLVELNTRFPKVLPRVVDQVGDRAKTQVIRTLTRQTGLPRKTIVKAVDPGRVHARPRPISSREVADCAVDRAEIRQRERKLSAPGGIR
jgi:hypothetical protein